MWPIRCPHVPPCAPRCPLNVQNLMKQCTVPAGGSESHLEGSEALLEGSEAQLEGSEAQLEASEGQLEGSEG